MRRKSILIFDTEVSGHHLEYIHHLFIKAKNSKDNYIFYLPNEFKETKDFNFDWESETNIIFSFFDSENINEIKSFHKLSWRKCSLLKEAIEKFNITHVFLITLIGFLPFLPFFIPSSIKVSGIIYQIYLYRWKKSSIYQRFLDILKYLIIRFSNCLENVYILNDDFSAKYLNKLYKTNKFKYLVDPYVEISSDPHINRTCLKIPQYDIVYLHLGDMRDRKGTLEILKAIKLCSETVLEKSTFIFAGKVHNEIKDEFYHLLRVLPPKTKVLVYDRFCDYSFFGSLCKIANCILIPYKITGQSTGIIGYAAQYEKPVLGPSTGLIGKLIKKYKLGYTIVDINASSIYQFISSIEINNKASRMYVYENTIEKFIKMISF